MKNAKIRKYFHCMSRNSLERQNQFGTLVRKSQIVFSAICIFFVRYSNIKMLVAAFIFSRKPSHLISHISLFPLIDIPVIKHTINPRHCVSQLKDKDNSYDTIRYTLLKDDNAFNFKVSPYIIRFKKYIKEFNA